MEGFAEIFFKGWFAVSSFIMLYLYLKLRDSQSNFTDTIDREGFEELMTKWNQDYLGIVAQYGNIENFIQAHSDDFAMMRETILDYIVRERTIINYFVNANKGNKNIKRGTVTDFIAASLLSIEHLEEFVKHEYDAHESISSMDEIIEEIHKYYITDDLRNFLEAVKEESPEVYKSIKEVMRSEYATTTKH